MAKWGPTKKGKWAALHFKRERPWERSPGRHEDIDGDQTPGPRSLDDITKGVGFCGVETPPRAEAWGPPP